MIPSKFEERLNHNIKWHGLVNYNWESQKESMRKSFNEYLLKEEKFGNMESLKDINMLNDKEYSNVIPFISVICGLYSMFFKREYFKGEKEYRFVFSDVKKDSINFRTRNSMIIPYIKKNVEDLEFITKIMIGPTNQSDIAKKGIKELLNYYDRDVEVVKAEIPLRF